MNRLMPCAFPLSFCLAVVAAALALVACGGSIGGESVTSAPVVESAASALDNGTVSASGTDKVPVCHKGETKFVPQGAEGDHLGHGDTPGICCPCFSGRQIVETWGACSPDDLFVACNLGDPAFLLLRCFVVGDTVPDVPTEYSSGFSDPSLRACNVVPGGPGSRVTLESAAEHEACGYALESTGYCS